LEDFDIFGVLDTSYAEYFGFTSVEVENLLNDSLRYGGNYKKVNNSSFRKVV
jgi:hypothetical protein